MKRGRPIKSDTPLARFTRAADLSYSEISNATGEPLSTIKHAACGKQPLPQRTALAISAKYDVLSDYLLGIRASAYPLTISGKKWTASQNAITNTTSGFSSDDKKNAMLEALIYCADQIHYLLLDDNEFRLGLADALHRRQFPAAGLSTGDLETRKKQYPTQWGNDGKHRIIHDNYKSLVKAWEEQRKQNDSPTNKGSIFDRFDGQYNACLKRKDPVPDYERMQEIVDLLFDAKQRGKFELIETELIYSLFDLRKKFKVKTVNAQRYAAQFLTDAGEHRQNSQIADAIVEALFKIRQKYRLKKLSYSEKAAFRESYKKRHRRDLHL